MHEKSASYWIDTLQMNKHPEGGWYVETFRDEYISSRKSASTAIYFLLTEAEVSHFHRIASVEMWHFYAGAPVVVHQIDAQGEYTRHVVGADWEQGERFQAVVPAGAWFAAESTGAYSLVGCTVAPGFEFADFELGQRQVLVELFPKHRELIEQFTTMDV